MNRAVNAGPEAQRSDLNMNSQNEFSKSSSSSFFVHAPSSESMGLKYVSREKIILVTVGSTSFNQLIEAVLDPEFLEVAVSQGYKELRIQYGTGAAFYFETFRGCKPFLEERWGTRKLDLEDPIDGIVLARSPLRPMDDEKDERSSLPPRPTVITIPLRIRAFDYDTNLHTQMSSSHVVISHAGE